MHSYGIGEVAIAHMDGGQTEGRFYLRGYDARQVPRKERTHTLVEATDYEGRDVEGVADVDHLIRLANEPGNASEWLEIEMPGPDEDRSSKESAAYYDRGKRGVSTVRILLRRADLREFAIEIYRRQINDLVDSWQEKDCSIERVQHLHAAWSELSKAKRKSRG